MAQHFTLSELLHSDTAEARGIQNTPPHDVLRRLNYLMDNCLDPIRRLWGKPIGVNSGYRSPALNAAVGGVATSQHVKGEAADITTGTVEGNKQLFDMICASDISSTNLSTNAISAGFTFPVKWEASVIVVLSCICKPMKRYYFAIVAAVLLCACASTRNTSRSSTQERVEERAESERQTSTQEQTEEQRDVVTISKTTTETKSTTTIYDTSSPAADSLGIPPPQQTTTTETKTTNTTATVDKSVIRQIVDEQLREAANEQTTTNKQEDTSTEEIKEDSTPKNLRWLGIIAICTTVIMGCFFVLRFVGRK